MIDAILFDFDGVLADTEPVHFACWDELLRPLGIVMDWETYSTHCIGISERRTLEFWAMRFDQAADLGLIRVKQQVFRRRVLEAVVCTAETVSLIQTVAARMPVAVVTSSGREEVEPVLKQSGIFPHLRAAVYGGDVARLKPAPDPYLRAAELVEAKCPLVIEDSAPGVASAQAAGFEVIRVAHPREVPARVRDRLTSWRTV